VADDDVQAISRATLRASVVELRRDVSQLEARALLIESRLGVLDHQVGKLEGRELERDQRSRRTAELRVARDRRYIAAKIIAAAVTIASGIVAAVKC